MTIKNTLSLLLFLASSTWLSAQYNVVAELDRPMSFGTRPAFQMVFKSTDANTVETMWRDFAKKNFGAKLKKDRKSGEWTAANLSSPIVGSEHFTIYSTVEKAGDGAVLTIWFDAGSYFLSRRDNAGRSEEVSRTLQTLYFDVRRTAINDELKVQQDQLADLQKKQKAMQKDNDDLHKAIENYKEKIKKAEEDIVKNEKDQNTNLVDQDAQRRQIDETQRRINNVESEKN
ncbi:MAG: hypothetical protein ABIO24_10030 [Saprospiraceae bacterium]